MPTTSAVELSSSAPAGANVETVVAIGYRCVRSAAVPSPPLGNADSALHCAVLDRAAPLSVDDEIAAHSIDVDTAGPLRLDAHGSANAADVDAARSVVANGKVAGDVIRVNVPGAVVDFDVAADAPEHDITRSVLDPNVAGDSRELEVARSIRQLHSARSPDFQLTAPVLDVQPDVGGNFDVQVELLAMIAPEQIPRRMVAFHVGHDDLDQHFVTLALGLKLDVVEDAAARCACNSGYAHLRQAGSARHVEITGARADPYDSCARRAHDGIPRRRDVVGLRLACAGDEDAKDYQRRCRYSTEVVAGDCHCHDGPGEVCNVGALFKPFDSHKGRTV